LQFGRFKLASWVELIVIPVGSWQVIGLFVGQWFVAWGVA
jgi:hypothetical protein